MWPEAPVGPTPSKRRLAALSVALLSIVAGWPAIGAPASATRPAMPRIEDGGGWKLSEGCRVYRYGMLTDPDCDLLSGEGIVIQVTRVRVLSLPPGEDNRPAIGIQFQPAQGGWDFSAPFVALLIGDRSYAAEIDQALVFARGGHPIVPEKLASNQHLYELPSGEKRFYRLRFPVDQSELAKGFALRVTGLHRNGEAVPVPLMKFE
ncbi:MAG: hypothetical protein JSS40_13610 [Proteobacteria bacterium]|nr:hypothetical protein [Pseudomonadota bacterium]